MDRIKERKMFKSGILAFSALALLCGSLSTASELPKPSTPEKPAFKVNDTWTYRTIDRFRNGETKERHLVVSILRTHSDSILQSAKAVDSSLPPVEKILGADLSVKNSINGKEVTVHKPFDFPLETDKKWEVAYERSNPNKTIKLSKVKIQYTVTGWEEVTVPAGKFQALKVEAEGTWYNELNPTPSSVGSVSEVDASGATVVVKNQKSTVSAPITGKIFRTYWYVPAIKRDVKNIEEDFTTDGFLSKRSTWELESYGLDGGTNKAEVK
jgi:hypothetical protein